MLCMPIFNGRGSTIGKKETNLFTANFPPNLALFFPGVARLTNKLNGLPFNQADQDSFEVLTKQTPLV